MDDESIAGKPMKLKFTPGDQNYIQAFNTLFTALNKNGEDVGNFITRSDYDQGYTLFVYHLQPFSYNTAITRGNLKIQGTFSTALQKNTTMIVYAKFFDILEIDAARNIIQ